MFSVDIWLFRRHLLERVSVSVAGTRHLSWRQTAHMFGGLLVSPPLCFPSARLSVLPDHAVLITTALHQAFVVQVLWFCLLYKIPLAILDPFQIRIILSKTFLQALWNFDGTCGGPARCLAEGDALGHARSASPLGCPGSPRQSPPAFCLRAIHISFLILIPAYLMFSMLWSAFLKFNFPSLHC